MSLATTVFSGAPTSAVNASSRQANLGLDQDSGTLYYTGPATTGWQKVAAGTTTGFSGTIVTAQLTPSTGTQGSITVVNGVITAVVAAT
jgi:tartrate dehydratase beta subunit/fumarate hydratase class I family protein